MNGKNMELVELIKTNKQHKKYQIKSKFNILKTFTIYPTTLTYLTYLKKTK